MSNRKLFEDLSSSAKRKRKSENYHETSDSVQTTMIIKKHANKNIKNSVISEATSLDIDFEFPSIPKVLVNNESSNFRKKLARWAANNNIKRNAITSLLHILKEDRYPDLPCDSRTLLKTPRQVVIQDMPPGKYIYIGLKMYLENICSSLKVIPKCLELDLNIDGAPIFHNSFENGCIWPILGRIKNLNSSVFAIAIYGGKKKPDDFNSLLKPFVDDFNDLKRNFKIREKQVQLKINNIICDAPARSAICNTYGHTGLSCCPKCHIVGKRIENRSAFPSHIAQLRTNEEFRDKVDEEFHHGICEFEKIEELDMINNFPIDYMHACLHGIMKKLLDLWFGFGTRKKPLYSASIKSRVSQKILKFVQVQPIDFQRHCRGLDQLGNWKATEFRSFALFIGPSVLENEISIEHYRNFMLFHITLTILIHNDLCINYYEIAKEIVYKFVEEVAELYGAHIITYNFHVFTHLSDDCERNGALDNFSAFPFESFLGKLKTFVHSPLNPLSQIHNRINELIEVSTFGMTEQENSNYNFKHNELIVNNRKLVVNGKDNFVLTFENNIMKILNFVKHQDGKIFANCEKFIEVLNIYELPIESTDINCFKVNINSFSCVTIEIHEIKYKLFISPEYNNHIYVYPLNS